MRTKNPHWKMSACLAAAALTFLGSLAATQAQSAPLNAKLTLRPLTSTEIDEYGITGSNAQVSAGIRTIGLGEPAYLEALVNNAVDPATITNVTWTLTLRPQGSLAIILPSPLGTNVPVYKPSDRLLYAVGGRALMRPDVVGTYTVNCSIQTSYGASTNLSITLTGATYLGLQTCAACHSGAFATAPDIYPGYTNTPHATFFERSIDGLTSSHYNSSCIRCHTLGYDTNSFAINGGFDDEATLLGWKFPSTLTNGNWAAMPSQLKNLANIQCENCHGPGSQHIYSDGVVGNTNAISVSYAAADCSQCHDDLNNHVKSVEWQNSLHAITTTHPAGNASCVGCHTAMGFVGRMKGWTNVDTAYMPITCQACHDPHSYNATINPYELRVTLTNSVTFANGAVITTGGAGKLCMECHHARQDAATYATNTANISPYFGPHHGPQGDMLEGVNGFTYGENIPSSAHANAVSNTCVTCHMQAVATSDPAFSHAGGHTFNVSWSGGDLVAACQKCHGDSIKDFNFKLQDYDGDGVIEGVQTEVQHLLNKLAMLLPPIGQTTVSSPSSGWTAQDLEADYNYQFVNNDGSMGIHNTAYAVGLLKASIANLTGKPYVGGPFTTNDIAFYQWQNKWFGSASAAGAGYNDVNNSSGTPNWLMFDLGLNPYSNAEAATNGVIRFDGNNIVNGATNTIAIYTAAEVVFNTSPNDTYQVWGASAVSGGWNLLSTNIPGTGASISYLTPTRGTNQWFFRVSHTPVK